MTRSAVRSREDSIRELRASAYRIPTDRPEADGTLEWDATTIVVVHAVAGSTTGLGYTYADVATARFIVEHLAPVVVNRPAMDVPECWEAMRHAIRNVGRPGIASMAIAAVDVALWDLKARLLSLPLVTLLGGARGDVPLYGSGGFTSYDDGQLVEQLSGWARDGFGAVKMKIGTEGARDVQRVMAARTALGAEGELFVDANGAYDAQGALAMADRLAEFGVSWFEEPVSSDDLAGLRLVRDRSPPGMRIAAGEYGYDLPYFRRMCEAGAVDVLQADVTRCAGITEFLRVGALCEAFALPLSAHTAPALHLHPGCAVPRLVHLEYFHDHARVERLLFEGVVEPSVGRLRPDRGRPGHGLELKGASVDRYRIG